jgi:biopolymer transport protein ExbD
MSGGADVSEEEGGGGSRKNTFGEESAAVVSLNLTALMDILSNLLFFLLACFGATIVMAINGSVPVQSADKSDLADTKQSVTVNITINKTGLDMSVLGTAQSQEELDKWKKRIPNKAGAPDFATMAQILLDIKTQYPKSDTVILTPETGINYELLIKTMDAARESEVKVSGKIRPVSLFPTVVVSTVVK